MTIYFKKINLNIDNHNLDIRKLKGNKLFDYGAICYYDILDDEYYNDIFSGVFIVPPVKRFYVEAKDKLNPHRDNGAISCLNLYIGPQNYTTNFWEEKENARRISGHRYDPVTNKYTEVNLAYVRDDLNLVDSFTAQNNEAYLLNIGEIHSVDGDRQLLPRVMLQFQWNMTIEEMIEQLGFQYVL